MVRPQQQRADLTFDRIDKMVPLVSFMLDDEAGQDAEIVIDGRVQPRTPR
jgi:hypothetical protein